MHPALTPTEVRLLVEHSPVMIWRSGLDANCDYFNDTWLAFTGRTRAQEMGEGWAEGAKWILAIISHDIRNSLGPISLPR